MDKFGIAGRANGYRVYFGEHKGRVILLLTGGDKSTQRKDIPKAIRFFWDA